jgi:chaperonin GroEL
MPEPKVILGEEGRIGMLRGFESMGRLMALTLGPIGGKIANERDVSREPELLGDAATIARRILQIPDRVEDAGAMMMRHIVWNVREEMGDGSATTAVIARTVAQEMQRMIAAGANAMILKRGIEKAVEAAVQALDEMAIPLEGEEEISAVATAAIGDPEIGGLLGEIYDVLGPHANVVISPWVATSHDRAYHEGARFESKYSSSYLFTDTLRHRTVLDDVYVLVVDMILSSTKSVQHILEQVLADGGKNLFIICRQIHDTAVGVLVANNEADTVHSCAASLKPVGDLRRATHENIALLTGGKHLTDQAGSVPEEITIEDFGRCDRVIITKEYFTIIGGKGDRQVIRERAKALRQQLRESHDAEEKEEVRELLGHFSAGVGELRIGALTEKERSALTETAEQAMKAVAAGMEGGIVPGGGAAYLACIPAVEAVDAKGDEAIGVRIIARALEEPMRCIATNANVHPPLVIARSREAGAGYGFDTREKEIVNMIQAGIADPAVVTRRALQHGVSGAMMLLTTDALVLHRKPKESMEP